MASAVHISIGALSPEVKTLIDRALRGEEIVIDGADAPVRITRIAGPTAAEVLGNSKLWNAASELDDEWAQDMEIILGSRKNDRDSWV